MMSLTFGLFTQVSDSEFMELVEDLDAKVNKCNYINEYINLFAIYR